MASQKMRLSKARINALATPDEMLTVWDDEIPGFFLLVTPRGTRTFYLQGRTRDGTQFRFKIGRFGTELTAEQARAEAVRLRAAIALGRDPAAERRARRRERAARENSPTVADLWGAFVEAHNGAWRPNTTRSYRSWFQQHVAPAIGEMKAPEVTPPDVRRMYRAIVKPATQVQALRCVSAMFSWAVASDDYPMIETNPCLKAIGKSDRGPGINRREREPEGDELPRMVRALLDRGDEIGMFFVLLLLLGCRESELLGALWREFDLDHENPVWRKPAASTKGKAYHRVTLSLEAVELLLRVKQAHPFAPFTWLKPHVMRREWHAVCAAAGVTDLRIHDWARHFHASLLAAEGYGLLEIGKALGHRNQATTARYTHVVDRRQREAAQAIGKVISLAGGRS